MARCCAACPALRHLALNASFALPALKYAAAQGLRTLAVSSYKDIFMRPLGRLTDLHELQLRGHRVRGLHRALQLPPNLTKLCFSQQARAEDWEEGTHLTIISLSRSVRAGWAVPTDNPGHACCVHFVPTIQPGIQAMAIQAWGCTFPVLSTHPPPAADRESEGLEEPGGLWPAVPISRRVSRPERPGIPDPAPILYLCCRARVPGRAAHAAPPVHHN
jgi:hypothetical protein